MKKDLFLIGLPVLVIVTSAWICGASTMALIRDSIVWPEDPQEIILQMAYSIVVLIGGIFYLALGIIQRRS